MLMVVSYQYHENMSNCYQKRALAHVIRKYKIDKHATRRATLLTFLTFSV